MTSEIDLDAIHKAALSAWLQSECDLLPSRAAQYAALFAGMGISSVNRLMKSIARNSDFLKMLGVDPDDAEEIMAALSLASMAAGSEAHADRVVPQPATPDQVTADDPTSAVLVLPAVAESAGCAVPVAAWPTKIRPARQVVDEPVNRKLSGSPSGRSSEDASRPAGEWASVISTDNPEILSMGDLLGHESAAIESKPRIGRVHRALVVASAGTTGNEDDNIVTAIRRNTIGKFFHSDREAASKSPLPSTAKTPMAEDVVAVPRRFSFGDLIRGRSKSSAQAEDAPALAAHMNAVASTEKGSGAASAQTLGLDVNHFPAARVLSSITEETLGGGDAIAAPIRRKTSSNISFSINGNDLTPAAPKASVSARHELDTASESDTIEVKKSFSLVKLFEKSDKNVKRAGLDDPMQPRPVVEGPMRPTCDALLAFGTQISHAVDSTAGMQVIRHCSGLCALIDVQMTDRFLISDVISSGISSQVVTALLRFSDDMAVSEACLEAVCAICSISINRDDVGIVRQEEVDLSSKLHHGSADAKIIKHFGVPDTFTALNAVLFHCDALLNVAAKVDHGSGLSSQSTVTSLDSDNLTTNHPALDTSLSRNQQRERNCVVTIVNLTARIMGILSSYVPNAVCIADGGVYDNLIRVSATLVQAQSDVAAEVCWVTRCLASNRLNLTIKKLFMSSNSTVDMLVSSFGHDGDKLTCRRVSRAIINLCAIDPICILQLLSANIIKLLSQALEKHIDCPETVKWITMSFSSLLMSSKHSRTSVVASMPGSTPLAPVSEIGDNDQLSSNIFISAVRSKSAAAIFRGNGGQNRGIEGGKFAPHSSDRIRVSRDDEFRSFLRVDSTQSQGTDSDVTPVSLLEPVKSNYGLKSIFKLHSRSSKGPVQHTSSSELLGRLRRSTSTLDPHSIGTELGILEEQEVIAEFIIRPVLETKLCDMIVKGLRLNGAYDAYTAEWLCHTIYFLSLNDALLPDLAAAKACEAVVKIIAIYSATNTMVMRRACTALGSLCQESAENRDTVYKLNGHFYIVNSLLAHGRSDDNHKSAAVSASRTNPEGWQRELSIVQECWALKKLAVDIKLRKTLAQYSLYEAIDGLITKYSGHIDITLQCLKLLIVMITREERDSLHASLDLKDKISIKILMAAMSKCINDLTTVKYGLILISVLCCRFSSFNSLEGEIAKNNATNDMMRCHKFQDLHKCMSQSCAGWHGPYIDDAECSSWAKRVADPTISADDTPLVPLCSCRVRVCDHHRDKGMSTAALDYKDNSLNSMFSHYYCYSLPDMQNALNTCRAPDFIVSCMKQYAATNVTIAEWGCRAVYAMTVEGRGDAARLSPLLRGRNDAKAHTGEKYSGNFVGGKTFVSGINFRENQFNDYALETDILRKGEINFGGRFESPVGVHFDGSSDLPGDISDIYINDRPYHGYFQVCHYSSLETADVVAQPKRANRHKIGTQRMLNGDGVNFKSSVLFVKLGISQILSDILQAHSSNELAIVWAARATSNVMSSKMYIDSADGHKLRIFEDADNDDMHTTQTVSRIVSLAKESSLLDRIFQLMHRSALSHPAISQYLCETIYVLAQDPVLSSWMGGLGACLLVYDIFVEYMPYFTLCQASLLAMGALSKTCSDNVTRFHIDTNMDTSYNEILSAIKHHRCEHSPGVAEEGFLAALYCSNTGDGACSGDDAKMSPVCPAVINSVLEYHCTDIGVCLAALYFLRRNTLCSEANSVLVCANNGKFFNILLDLMQRRVDVICGCMETAEVRMNDIMLHTNDEDLMQQAGVDDFFESQTIDNSVTKPTYLNTFNSKLGSRTRNGSSNAPVTQRHVDEYYESIYSDTHRRGDGGPYSVISLGCILIAHFSGLQIGDGMAAGVSACSPRSIMLEGGVCEMLTLILNSSMVDAVCLGADFRQSGVVPDAAKSAATASEYKILMGPRTAFHVLSSVVEASGVSVISRSSIMSLVAIFSLLRSGCNNENSCENKKASRCSVQSDACTRLLALGVGTSLIACLRSFPLIMRCIVSRLSLNTLALLSVGCSNVISQNDDSYIDKFFSMHQRSAVSLKNLKNLFLDQIDNSDAWKAVIDAVPYFVSTRNPLLWLTDPGKDNLSPDDEMEAATSVAIVISACRCIIAASGFGVGYLVSGVILSQANAFNVLFTMLRSLKLGGPVEVTVALLRAIAACSHEIGSREKPDVVEVILKYMTEVANSPAPVLVAALQCICSLSGGMSPVYVQRGQQSIYVDGNYVLDENAPQTYLESEAYYFDHIHRHIGTSSEGFENVMMLQSHRACSKIVKTLLRQMKVADLLTPAAVGSALANIARHSFHRVASNFTMPLDANSTKEATGVIDVIQWCLIAMITMCKSDSNKIRLCTAECADCLISLLRVCGRVPVGGRTVPLVHSSTSILWNLSPEDYTEMIVSRGCGCDVEWIQGINRASFRVLTEYAIKAIIALCVGPSGGSELSLLDEICDRVDVGLSSGEDTTGSRAAATSSDKAGVQGLSMMRWFKKTVKTIKRQKSNSFHDVNITKFIGLRTPAVLLDILTKYGENSALICYLGSCGFYMLCGASLSLYERGGAGTVINDLLLAGGSGAEAESTLSTDSLWGHLKMPLMTSSETGIGYDSGSIDPFDAAHTLRGLLQRYTGRSRSALRACARVVGLLASVKSTSPISTALGYAGCCKAILAALAVRHDDSITSVHILHAIAGLAASSRNKPIVFEDSPGFDQSKVHPNSVLLSELGAIRQISSIVSKSYERDLELCMVSCKALYFLMNIPGFCCLPIGIKSNDNCDDGEHWTDFSIAQNEVMSSNLLDNLVVILQHYVRSPCSKPNIVRVDNRRRSVREQFIGEPCARAIMLTACLLCISRVPLFMECEARVAGVMPDICWTSRCHMPALIHELLRQFGAQNIAPIVYENLSAAAFAGLNNLLKQPMIKLKALEDSGQTGVDFWITHADVLMEGLSKFKSPVIMEFSFLCMAAMASCDPIIRAETNLLCMFNPTVQDKAVIATYKTRISSPLEALGIKGACEKVLGAIQSEASCEVILATLQAYYGLIAHSTHYASEYGNRSSLCSEKALRRLIITGDTCARQNSRIAIMLCRIIAYITSCNFYEASMYQSRLMDHKVANLLKSIYLLYDEQAEVIQTALIATAFLAHQSNKIRDKLGSVGICELVCALLPKYIDVNEHVVWCCLFSLLNLCASNAKNAFKIGSCGACDHILKAIKLYSTGKDLCNFQSAELTIDAAMGAMELPDCFWLHRFGLAHFGDVMTVGCYAIVNLASFADVLSLPLLSAKFDAQFCSESYVATLMSSVKDYIKSKEELKIGGDDRRLFSANLSRLRASGACEILVDMMKMVSELVLLSTDGESDQKESTSLVLSSLLSREKAVVLAILRLCDDVSNIQRMKVRGIEAILSSASYHCASVPDAVRSTWDSPNFWSDLSKDSAIHSSCFESSGVCSDDIKIICGNIMKKIQE